MNEVMQGVLEAPGLAVSVPSAHTPEERVRRMVQEHFDFVWRSMRALGVSEVWAEDAAQHVFVIAAQKLAEIAPGNERAFLFGTTRGVAANVRRSRSVAREVANEVALQEAADEGRNPEEEASRREQVDMLQSILDAMPEELRIVFVLFELEGMTSAEIAEMIAIPVGTAASRLRRARDAFQTLVTRAQARTSLPPKGGSR